jgi:hypothetical protein
VIKEDDLPAQLGLEPPRGQDFGKKEPAREKPAGLLAETNYGRSRHQTGREAFFLLAGCVEELPSRNCGMVEGLPDEASRKDKRRIFVIIGVSLYRFNI